LAVEDELSDFVLRRILQDFGNFSIGMTYRRGGFGYLRSTISGWNRAARSIPFALLTDLDEFHCPAELITDWLPAEKHPNLLFRVAVREVESWLLADQESFSSFLGIAQRYVSIRPDDLPDPKAFLVDLAKRSRHTLVRESLVPRKGSTAKQGPGYNGCLGWFVKKNWRPEIACLTSPSLARTMERFSTFEPKWV
jgi:hypothetical protein